MGWSLHSWRWIEREVSGGEEARRGTYGHQNRLHNDANKRHPSRYDCSPCLTLVHQVERHHGQPAALENDPHHRCSDADACIVAHRNGTMRGTEEVSCREIKWRVTASADFKVPASWQSTSLAAAKRAERVDGLPVPRSAGRGAIEPAVTRCAPCNVVTSTIPDMTQHYSQWWVIMTESIIPGSNIVPSVRSKDRYPAATATGTAYSSSSEVQRLLRLAMEGAIEMSVMSSQCLARSGTHRQKETMEWVIAVK